MTISSAPWWESNSGSVDRTKIFRLRFNRLGIGDALYCPKTGWRVICLYRGSNITQFAVYENRERRFPIDQETTSNRDSVLQFVVESADIPPTLEYTPNGTLGFVRVSKNNKLILIVK